MAGSYIDFKMVYRHGLDLESSTSICFNNLAGALKDLGITALFLADMNTHCWACRMVPTQFVMVLTL